MRVSRTRILKPGCRYVRFQKTLRLRRKRERERSVDLLEWLKHYGSPLLHIYKTKQRKNLVSIVAHAGCSFFQRKWVICPKSVHTLTHICTHTHASMYCARPAAHTYIYTRNALSPEKREKSYTRYRKAQTRSDLGRNRSLYTSPPCLVIGRVESVPCLGRVTKKIQKKKETN